MPDLRLALAAALVATPALAQPVPVTERVPPPPAIAVAPAPERAIDRSTPPDFSGALDEQDPTIDGKAYETHRLDVPLNNEVTVTMTADDFDTYLTVLAPSGEEWSNDDFNGTRASQVRFIVREAGPYTIRATTYRADSFGAYDVRVERRAVQIVSEVSGRLDYQDEQLLKGEYVDRVTLQTPNRGEFFVELSPLGFQGYLRVTSPDGVAQRGTVPYTERVLRLGPFRAGQGAWTADVTTQALDEVGAYDLRVLVLDEQ